MYNFTKEVRGYKKTTVEYEQLNPTFPKEGKGNHVFMCGALTVLDPVRDEAFGVFTDQPFLSRKIETYHWQETRKEVGNKTETTYKSVWSDQIIKSDGFANKNYRNTPAPYSKEYFYSKETTMGTYKVDIPSLNEKLEHTSYSPANQSFIYSKGCNHS